MSVDEKLSEFETVQAGLNALGNVASSMKDNMEAKISDASLFREHLNSKTALLYGGFNEDRRYQFKIDNNFDLKSIGNAEIDDIDGSAAINHELYSASQGTEFVIIKQSDIGDGFGDEDYAICASKYAILKGNSNSKKINAIQLEKFGGFKLNSDLTSEEAKRHDGWIELAVGKNKATQKDYSDAKELLAMFITESEKHYFYSGKGMEFSVNRDPDLYSMRFWCLGGSNAYTVAFGKYDMPEEKYSFICKGGKTK